MRERNLRAVFGYVLSVTLPLAAAEACSSDDTPAPAAGRDGGASSSSSSTSGGVSSSSSGGAAECGKCGCNPPAVPPNKVVAFTPDCDGGTAEAGSDAAIAECLGERCSTLCAAQSAGNVHPSCQIVGEDAGTRAVECSYALICGRRPEGWSSPLATKAGGVAEYLGHAAAVEAASVEAFAVLAQELRAHGAPESLTRAAERAAEDEIRHARVMRTLASRGGMDAPGQAARSAPPVRSLEAIAIENAREGCVREAYGALLAMHQGRCAEDRGVRAAMRAIADDETRHAELAWAISDWAEPLLDAQARSRVAAAREGAVAELLAAVGVEPEATLARALGLPRAAGAQAAVRALAALVLDAPAAA